MKLLDLFCKAGGASMGYHRAGFEVTGVDIEPQKRYPFRFIQGDALQVLADIGRDFDVIAASPPCQAFSALKSMPNAKKHADLIAPTRALLKQIGKPYIIENVMGAPLINPLMLCGTMFGLGVKEARAELRRHRIFETSFFMLSSLRCRHNMAAETIGVYGDGAGLSHARRAKIEARAVQVVGVYGGGGAHGGRPARRPRTVGVWGNAGGFSIRKGCQQFTTTERAEAMGIDWMTGAELSQAIPPAYTQFIGTQLLERLTAQATPATPTQTPRQSIPTPQDVPRDPKTPHGQKNGLHRTCERTKE